jgi:hypothetical protein
MSSRNTVIRSLHDLGAAAWFGGSLMGAAGVNGAAAAVRDPQDRARIAAVGWGKWTPFSAAAIGAHLIGGASIPYANRGRAKRQSGVTANTVTKLVLTGAALGATSAPKPPTALATTPPARPSRRRRHLTASQPRRSN